MHAERTFMVVNFRLFAPDKINLNNVKTGRNIVSLEEL